MQVGKQVKSTSFVGNKIQVSWINPLNTFLIFLTLDIAIHSIDTYNGWCDIAW